MSGDSGKRLQIPLVNMMAAMGWTGAACAAWAAAGREPMPDAGLMIWPGVATSCMLAAIFSLLSGLRAGILVGVGSAAVGMLCVWACNAYFF